MVTVETVVLTVLIAVVVVLMFFVSKTVLVLTGVTVDVMVLRMYVEQKADPLALFFWKAWLSGSLALQTRDRFHVSNEDRNVLNYYFTHLLLDQESFAQ